MQSKYDSNQDGVCDAPECNNVLHVTRNTDIWVNMEPVIEQALGKIGIKVVSREFEDSYRSSRRSSGTFRSRPRPDGARTTPTPRRSWSSSTAAVALPEGNVNYSLIGARLSRPRRSARRAPIEVSRASMRTSTRATRSSTPASATSAGRTWTRS